MTEAKPLHPVLVLATPTPGDPLFYDRWEAVGPVSNNFFSDATRNMAEVLVVDHGCEVRIGLLAKLPRLKIIATPNTATTHIKVDCDALGIRLVSLKGCSQVLARTRSVAEFTFYLIGCLYRNCLPTKREFAGKVIGIIGFGRIGRHVLEIAQGYQMPCILFDRIVLGSDLVRTAQSCDILSVHLSEEPGNEKIVSKAVIDSMRPGSIFINTARGSLVDEWALASALREGRIAGAACDVVADPLALNKTVPNLLLTGHKAGSALEARIRTDEFLCNRVKTIYAAHLL